MIFNLRDDMTDTVLVAFSATSIHTKLAKAALDMAEENNAKLIILSVRDQNMAEKVARMTKDHGFMGRAVVEKLALDIKKDRNELIRQRLGKVEQGALDRGIEFETVSVKGEFAEQVLKAAKECSADVVLIDNKNKKIGILIKSERLGLILVEN